MTDQPPEGGEAPAAAPQPPPAPPPKPRSPGVAALMIIGGIILLLPGLCSLAFMVLMSSNSSLGPLPILWFLCFAISAGGIVMLVRARR